MSAPISDPICSNLFLVIFNLYNFTMAFKTFAAFEEPPPRPLPGGMFFSSFIETPPKSYKLFNFSHALKQRLSLLFDNQLTLEEKLNPDFCFSTIKVS